MEFLIVAIVFVAGLIFLISGSHMNGNKISKCFYCLGTLGVVMAMYIAWPK